MRNIFLTTLLSVSLVGLADGVAPSSAEKPLVPRQVLENRQAYEALKDNLGIEDEGLSRIDVLEIIAVKFAGTLDRLASANAKNAADIDVLEKNITTLAGKIAADEKRLDEHDVTIRNLDADIAKLFDWSKGIDDELHKDYVVNGIAFKLSELQKSVRANSSDIRTLDNEIQGVKYKNQAQDDAIRQLFSALR